MVTFIKARCSSRERPFLSVADFVNRSLEGEKQGSIDFAKSGVLQQAIDETTGINESFADTDANNFDLKDNILVTEKALEAVTDRKLSTGVPGFLMQSDILSRIGSSIVARGDTFKIRAYGESRSKNGNIVARQFCEAVVERNIEFIDSSNLASERDYDRLSELNRKFGRKFRMVSFRWLNEDQI